MLWASMRGEAAVHVEINVDLVMKAEADELVVHSHAQTMVERIGERPDNGNSCAP
jgi:hypothetical protein